MSILIVGSANVDHVFRSPRLPNPGETILGQSFAIHPGGKGANQAVAAGKLGGSVSFVGCVGLDADGALLTQSLSEAGVDLQYLRKLDTPTGAAGILVGDEGTNVIVVAPGANAFVTAAQVAAALDSVKPKYVLAQLEIPIEAIEEVSHADRFILNPAPAQPLSAEILARCFALTPNETELEILTGIVPDDDATCQAAAWKLLDKGVENVIVTLGARGSYWVSQSGNRLCPPPHVNALDTTAAGDVFNGALVTFLAEGRDIANAIDLANHAAALSTTRPGAQESAPSRSELQAFAPWLV